MQMIRMYTGDDGVTHLEDVEPIDMRFSRLCGGQYDPLCWTCPHPGTIILPCVRSS